MNTQCVSINFPIYKYDLIVCKGFKVSLIERPCWWHRLWQRLLLGWEWEEHK